MRNGSFHNLIAANSTDAITPEVGMGATIIRWTDRDAATIVEVKSPSRIVVQEDRAERTDRNGMTDSGQQYDFTPNADATLQVFTKRRNGRWVQQGDPMHAGTCLRIGHRNKYHDYSF